MIFSQFPPFNNQRIEAFYQALGVLAVQQHEIATALDRSGFSAFRLRERFRSGFCESELESADHQRCAIETAKLLLTRPVPRMPGVSVRSLYHSDFLEALKRQRDAENGVPFVELRTKFPRELWRAEVDPCERRLVRARLTQPVGFEARWKAQLEVEAQAFADEVALHAHVAHGDLSGDTRKLFQTYCSVMEAASTPLGFFYDQPKSTEDCPIFTRHLNAEIDLCWVLEEPDRFVGVGPGGYLRPYLEVRRPDLQGRGSTPAFGRFLVVEIQHAVPDFVTTYGRFRTLNELETIVKAYVTLYALVAPTVVRVVSETLT